MADRDPAQDQVRELRGEIRALQSELDRTRRAADLAARARGALEERVDEQTRELQRRREAVIAADDLVAAAAAERRGDGPWNVPADGVVAAWDSAIVRAEINRRITGSATARADAVFVEEHLPAGPAAHAVVVGPANGRLVAALLRDHVATRVTMLDDDPDRLKAGRIQLPSAAREAVTQVEGRLGDPRLELAPADLVVSRGALLGVAEPDGWAQSVAGLLTAGGLLYLDDYVGPLGRRWSDHQLEIVQRLLDRLDEALKTDLVAGDGRLRDRITRPPEALGGDVSRPQQVMQAISRHLEPVDLRPYGGAIYGPLFDRIMGNFAGMDDLVRTIMEVDAILTEMGVVDTNYLWGVFRAPSAA